jgi:hypothetical protein
MERWAMVAAAETARDLSFEKVWVMFQETAKQIRELSKNIDGLNNTFGKWAEEMVSARLWGLFTLKFGYLKMRLVDTKFHLKIHQSSIFRCFSGAISPKNRYFGFNFRSVNRP